MLEECWDRDIYLKIEILTISYIAVCEQKHDETNLFNIPFISIVEWFLTGNKGLMWSELANSTAREMFLHLFYACEVGRKKIGK